MSTPQLCPDCKVLPGELHEGECGVAWCAVIGRRRVSNCQSGVEVFHVPDVDCRTVWTGEAPGTAECREYGFFAYPRWEVGEGMGWASCEEAHPNAILDLNRLLSECVWSEVDRKYVRR